MNANSRAGRTAVPAVLAICLCFLGRMSPVSGVESVPAGDSLASRSVAGPTGQPAQHPDLTGIWTWDTDIHPGAGRFDLVWPANPPFTQEAREKVAAYHKLVDPRAETPSSFCLGMGMPGSTLASGGYPMEVIQRPEQVTLLQEAHSEIRRIFIGQPRVPDSDLFPTRNGYSTGRWEGDTLVVETSFLQESVDQGSAHSDEARTVERFRLGRDAKGRKTLTDQLTLTDARFYTQPVSVTKTWIAMKKGGRMLDYECNEEAWDDHLEQLAKEAAKASAQPAVPPKP